MKATQIWLPLKKPPRRGSRFSRVTSPPQQSQHKSLKMSLDHLIVYGGIGVRYCYLPFLYAHDLLSESSQVSKCCPLICLFEV